MENIPETEKEFEALLQREGSVFGSYAKGKMAGIYGNSPSGMD